MLWTDFIGLCGQDLGGGRFLLHVEDAREHAHGETCWIVAKASTGGLAITKDLKTYRYVLKKDVWFYQTKLKNLREHMQNNLSQEKLSRFAKQVKTAVSALNKALAALEPKQPAAKASKPAAKKAQPKKAAKAKK